MGRSHQRIERGCKPFALDKLEIRLIKGWEISKDAISLCLNGHVESNADESTR